MVKIGDKIMITKGHNNWCSSMDEYIGKTVIITGVDDGGYIKFNGGNDWSWRYCDGHFKILTEQTFEL